MAATGSGSTVFRKTLVTVQFAITTALLIGTGVVYAQMNYAQNAEQRTKEIGIRKVLGATIPGILMLLSKDFVKPVLLANLIAWPIAYYAMRDWLQNFAYRISLSIDTFALLHTFFVVKKVCRRRYIKE